jgi:hypothetical protein
MGNTQASLAFRQLVADSGVEDVEASADALVRVELVELPLGKVGPALSAYRQQLAL